MATVTTTQTTTYKLTDLDKKILDDLQNCFPLDTVTPFKVLAAKAEISELEYLKLVQNLKDQLMLRHIGPIFDPKSVGYVSSLLCMKVPTHQLAQTVEVINRYPGVTHNYERNEEYNIWFTLTVESEQRLQEIMAEIVRDSGNPDLRNLPKLDFYRIGVNFQMSDSDDAPKDRAQKGYVSQPQDWRCDFEFLKVVQQDLPLNERPYQKYAQELGISETAVLEKLNQHLQQGVVRRFSAALWHRNAGYKFNGMSIWHVPEARSKEVGEIMQKITDITHCYRRPTFADWPYSHYGMLHGMTKKEVEDKALNISKLTGITDYKVLYSTREFKKTSFRF
jgi:DNA-binding Lrp family transcriptional regulator